MASMVYTSYMNIVNPDPNIFVFENFISESDANTLLSLALRATDGEWSNYNYTERHENDEWEDRILILDKCDGFTNLEKTIVDSLFNKIQSEVNKAIDKYTYEYTGFNTIYRSVTGQSMKTHSDQGLGVKYKYGVVLYLNDSYDGGEIFYPNIGLEMKPKAYSLVVHPAHEAYRHGVKEVLSGTRYSMTTFLKLK